MEQRLTAFLKRNPHRISKIRQAERMKSARVAKQNGQQTAQFRQDADASLILLSCLGSLYYSPIHVSIIYTSVPLVS